MTLIWGTTPEARVFLRNRSAYPPRDATPSWMRAPPESLSPITGRPIFRARSMTLQILRALVSDSEPPKTVKSWLNRNSGRPSILAEPVTQPSPRILVFSSSMPKSRQRWVTKRSISVNEPGSTSSSMRSRAVSLPLLCWTSIRCAPPPFEGFLLQLAKTLDLW